MSTMIISRVDIAFMVAMILRVDVIFMVDNVEFT